MIRQYDEGRPMYGYFDETGRLLGYYSLHGQSEENCELNQLCVLPEYHHMRIGRELFFHACTIAAEKGFKRLQFGSVEKNIESFLGVAGDTQDIEFWDAYRMDGTLAGCDLIRGERIPAGLRHAVAEVLVLHRDGSVLLMQRDFMKKTHPGVWDSSAGGSVLRGEDVLSGARRELFEETGILSESSDLEPIGKTVSETTIYHDYLCVTDIPKDKIKLQKGETIAFRWVNEQKFREIFYSDQYADSRRERLRLFVETKLHERIEFVIQK